MYFLVSQNGKIAPKQAPMKAIIHPPQNPNKTPDTNLCRLAGAISKVRATYNNSHAIIPSIPFSGNHSAFSIRGARRVCVRNITKAIPLITPIILRVAINLFDM